MTPGGALFQLGTSQKGVYAVFRVGEDGAMYPRYGGDYPPPTTDRAGAIRSFRDWSDRHGYEYTKNALAPEPKRYKVTVKTRDALSVDMYLDAESPESAKWKASRRFRRYMKMSPHRMMVEEVERI